MLRFPVPWSSGQDMRFSSSRRGFDSRRNHSGRPRAVKYIANSLSEVFAYRRAHGGQMYEEGGTWQYVWPTYTERFDSSGGYFRIFLWGTQQTGSFPGRQFFLSSCFDSSAHEPQKCPNIYPAPQKNLRGFFNIVLGTTGKIA